MVGNLILINDGELASRQHRPCQGCLLRCTSVKTSRFIAVVTSSLIPSGWACILLVSCIEGQVVRSISAAALPFPPKTRLYRSRSAWHDMHVSKRRHAFAAENNQLVWQWKRWRPFDATGQAAPLCRYLIDEMSQVCFDVEGLVVGGGRGDLMY